MAGSKSLGEVGSAWFSGLEVAPGVGAQLPRVDAAAIFPALKPDTALGTMPHENGRGAAEEQPRDGPLRAVPEGPHLIRRKLGTIDRPARRGSIGEASEGRIVRVLRRSKNGRRSGPRSSR